MVSQMLESILHVNHEIQHNATQSAHHSLHTQYRMNIQIMHWYQMYLNVHKYHGR